MQRSPKWKRWRFVTHIHIIKILFGKAIHKVGDGANGGSVARFREVRQDINCPKGEVVNSVIEDE